jgi:uncharacterized membrane protein YeaQ/YmgE (transglycosylase-associated protein family)
VIVAFVKRRDESYLVWGAYRGATSNRGANVYLISVLVIGFFAGAIAKFFMPGKKPHGCLVTSLLGICGAWVGQQLLWTLGMSRPVCFIGSVLGAMILLFIYQALRKE